MTASVCGCVCVTCVCVRGEGLCVWPSVNLSSCVYMCRQHIWPGAWRSTCKEVTCFPSVDEQPADRLDSRFQFEKKAPFRAGCSFVFNKRRTCAALFWRNTSH